MSLAFDSFLTNLGKDINLSSDTLGCVLTNVLPVKATANVLSDIIQIAAGNGYTIDGPDVTILSWGDTDVAGVAELVNTQPTFAASGGTMATFRYAVLYDKTPISKYLISFYDYGSAKILTDGESIIVPLDNGANLGTLRVGVGTIASLFCE